MSSKGEKLRRTKIILVAEVPYPVTETRKSVMEALPDELEGYSFAIGDGDGNGNWSYGALHNVTVYVSAVDFDADRKAHKDHFAKKERGKWRPSIVPQKVAAELEGK